MCWKLLWNTKGICTATASGTQACNSGNRDSGCVKDQRTVSTDLLLFVTPPSAEILKERLTGRGTETEEVIHSRLSRAVEEADGCEVYDYLVVNDELDEAVENVHEIICSEQQRMRHKS